MPVYADETAIHAAAAERWRVDPQVRAEFGELGRYQAYLVATERRLTRTTANPHVKTGASAPATTQADAPA